jgi:splicing factor 3A subunit 1
MDTEGSLPIEEDLARPKQGKVTGVIIPPPDIRVVVDKTAQCVARNGKSFEQRILNSNEGKTAKFNFMRPFDPYHAYYEMKIRLVSFT